MIELFSHFQWQPIYGWVFAGAAVAATVPMLIGRGLGKLSLRRLGNQPYGYQEKPWGVVTPPNFLELVEEKERRRIFRDGTDLEIAQYIRNHNPGQLGG